MKARTSAKKNNKIVYLAIGAVVIVVAILFLSLGKNGADLFLPAETLKIENIDGSSLKIFNGEDVVIKSSDISFFINNAAIMCSGIKDLDPKKSAECTLEARCQKGDALKISYSGKNVEYNC